jgi:hypothetical protein
MLLRQKKRCVQSRGRITKLTTASCGQVVAGLRLQIASVRKAEALVISSVMAWTQVRKLVLSQDVVFANGAASGLTPLTTLQETLQA